MASSSPPLQSSSTPATSLPQSSQPSPKSEVSPLAALLSASLPSSSPPFAIHHLFHPPTRCSPLYSLPPGKKEPRTTSTSHFLAYLINETRRPGVSTHLTLFARAQDQYLFPNSVRNKSKHVLSDIQLIRWWARVLDPLLYTTIIPQHSTETNDDDEKENEKKEDLPKAYILVPGLDATDLRNVIPSKSWTHGHPYSHPSKPVRECIPHFEDDPKSRFMDELEDGGWRGVRTMKEFWELMAFRQECSLGKSVGFVSVVFEAESRKVATNNNDAESKGGNDDDRDSQSSTQSTSPQPKKRRSPDPEAERAIPKKRRLKLPIASVDIQSASTYTIASLLRNPQTRAAISKRSSTMSRRPSSFAGGTDIADGESSTKGGKILGKRDYDRLMTSLLDSDFEGMKCAKESSEIWIKMAGSEELPRRANEGDSGEVNGEVGVEAPIVHLLTVKKKKSEEKLGGNGVNVLMPRKKSKSEESTAVNVLQPRRKERAPEVNVPPVVNVLQPRKKAKEPEKESEPAINILQHRKKSNGIVSESITEATLNINIVGQSDRGPEPAINTLQPGKEVKSVENGDASCTKQLAVEATRKQEVIAQRKE
ncbi:hypothetical protein ABW20_dc0105236 [Dactylellina cionopaga]|nr:hypothetical protein ABW20_dc0105236 [Dactylellina cionopaga]